MFHGQFQTLVGMQDGEQQDGSNSAIDFYLQLVTGLCVRQHREVGQSYFVAVHKLLHTTPMIADVFLKFPRLIHKYFA